MDNKTDIMKAKAYIKNQYKELEGKYKNVLEEYFDERDRSDLAPRYMDEFRMLRYTGVELIEEIEYMQCRDIITLIPRLKFIVADCLIKEYALRYELGERDKNNDE